MAEVYREQDSGYPGITEYISYDALARVLFSEKQTIVPFLGAGASLIYKPLPLQVPLTKPEKKMVDAACTALGLDPNSQAGKFLEAAVRLAWEMNDSIVLPKVNVSEKAYERVLNSDKTPSANELAEVFAEQGTFDWFEQPAKKLAKLFPNLDEKLLREVCHAAAKITGVAGTVPPLLVAASYYSYKEQGEPAWKLLKSLLSNKSTPTKIDFLIASWAWYYMQDIGADSLLIITTNYDCLIEKALDIAGVPYWVLTVDKRNQIVHTRFSDLVEEYFGPRLYKELSQKVKVEFLAKDYHLMPPKPLVIIYKMHGCITPEIDSIIISDEDYVDFLRHDGPQHQMIMEGGAR